MFTILREIIFFAGQAMKLVASTVVLVVIVTIGVAAPLYNTVDVTIIRAEQDELEATVEWENGRKGMRIKAQPK